MKGVFLAFLALLVGTLTVHAAGNATLRVVPTITPAVVCPFAIDNGCSTSMVGQPGSAAVFLANGRASPATNQLNALTGSTTDYSNQPGTRFAGENFPGVDYWVGEYTRIASLKDPLDATVGVVATTPGCTYLATGGSNGGPYMKCFTIPGNANISGYDFTRGGTTCIPLDVEGTSTGTLTIEDNNWKNITGNCSIATNAANYMLKAGFENGHNIIAYNTLDMNALVWPFDYGSCAPNAGFCNPNEAFVFFGDVNAHHNAFLNFTGRTLQYVMANPSANFVFQHNYVQGCCASNASEHGEIMEMTSNVSGGQANINQILFDGNTLLVTTSHHTSGDAAFSPQFATSNFIPTYDFEDNFYVAGTSGGATASAKVTGTTAGFTFTTSAITSGTYGSGELTFCTSAGGNTLGFFTDYAGSTGTSAPGPAPGGNSNGNNVTTWPMTYDNNFSSTMTASLDDGTTAHATFTGTIAASTSNLTVSSVTHTIITGMWLFGPTGVKLGTITGGSGTAWTVSFTAGVGGVGPEAMTGVVPGNVMTVTDNTVMLGPAGTLGPLDLGTGVFIASVSRNVTAILTGTGNHGTYTVAGAAGAALSASGVPEAPNGIFPGSWGAGATTCTAATVAAQPFTVSWQRMIQLIGNFISANNTFDLYAYSAGANSVNVQASFAGRVFNGTITGNTLTINSGTNPGLPAGLALGPAGVLAGTYSISGATPTYTLNQTYSSTVGPESMTGLQVMCSVPATLSGNVDLTGVYTSSVNLWGSVVTGSGC